MRNLVIFLVGIASIWSFTLGVPLSESELDKNYYLDGPGCTLSLGEDSSPVLVPTGLTDFLYPKIGETSLTLAPGYSIDLICPGRKVTVGSETYNNYTTATCVSGTTLDIHGKNAQWKTIHCSSTAWRVSRFTGNTCEIMGKEVEIGFDIGDRFLRNILICFDVSRQQVLYSHAKIPASINQRNDKIPRPSWLQDSGIFEITAVTSHYVRTEQRKTVNAALGLSATSTKYIQDNDSFFLSRGHTTARSDNFYPAQQNASFFLSNVAPQWQTCNGGNWNTVEIYVRDYAEAHKVDLLEWTGVYGITTLPHEDTGKAVELYLYNKNGRRALPVPELYWKVAYEPISQKGIVFIVINNPYLSTYEPICEDVSSKVEGLNWDKDDQENGFGYVCTVDSLRKVVNYVPNFVVKGLLL